MGLWLVNCMEQLIALLFIQGLELGGMGSDCGVLTSVVVHLSRGAFALTPLALPTQTSLTHPVAPTRTGASGPRAAGTAAAVPSA